MFQRSLVFLVFLFGFCNGNYDESSAKKLINFVAASYLPVTDISTANLASSCFDKSYPNGGYKLKTINYIQPCVVANCQVLIAKSDSLKNIVIAFQGVIQKDDMDILTFYSTEDYVPWDIFDNGSAYGNVNKHFYGPSEAVWLSDIYEVISSSPDYSITFTGHALGAAIASLTALRTKILGFSQNISLYTFSEPRVGDHQWAEIFKSYVPDSNRVIHSSDIIPHMPICGAMFSDSCVTDDKNPYHQPQEIWYLLSMNDGEFATCSGNDGEDPYCSNSLPVDTLDDSFKTDKGLTLEMTYFNYKLDDYGRTGCIDRSTAITPSSGLSTLALSTRTTPGLSTMAGGVCSDSDADCGTMTSECRNSLYKPLMCRYCKKTCNLCNDPACTSFH